MGLGKTIFASIQYVIDSIFNHNKDATAHEDVRNQLTVLSDKVNWKPSDWKTESDLPNAYPINETVKFHATWNSQTGIISTSYHNHWLAFQTFTPTNGGKIIKFRTSNDNTWTAWQQIATTDKIDILQTNMLNGWLINPTQKFIICKVGDIVNISLSIKNPSTTGYDSIITKIPSIYIPKNSTTFECYNYDDISKKTTGVVATDGNMAIHLPYYNANEYINANITYSLG